MEPHDPAELLMLPFAIGDDRFSTYLEATDGDTARAIRLYSWNVEVAASLWGDFHLLEVTLRNALHAQLARFCGRDEWWLSTTLTAGDQASIRRVTVSLDRTKRDRWVAGHVVAELSFGFWTGLLANRYHAQLWEPAVRMAFDRSHGRRGSLHASLERLRKLRNRIAHHEPIFTRDLEFDHAQVLRILRSLNTDVALWNESHSRLPAIIAGREATLAGSRSSRF